MECSVRHGCPLSFLACIGACSAGNLQCLQYLREHGAPWEVTATITAAQHGHLDCLVYAHSQGCPVHADREYGSDDEGVLNKVAAYFAHRGVAVVNLKNYSIRGLDVTMETEDELLLLNLMQDL